VLVNLMDRPLDAATTIVAADNGVTIAALAKTIARTMDYTGPILFDQGQPEGVLIKRIVSSRFSSLFPDFQFTPLQEGLTETIRWFLSHHEQAAEQRRTEPLLCPQST